MGWGSVGVGHAGGVVQCMHVLGSWRPWIQGPHPLSGRPDPSWGTLSPNAPTQRGLRLPQNIVRVIARQVCTNVCVWHRALVGVTDCHQKERTARASLVVCGHNSTDNSNCMIARARRPS